jgi:hypothetical protein
VTITRNSKDLDVKPALDMMMQTRIQQSKYWKEKMQRLELFLGKGLILIFLAFSWILGMKMQSRLQKQ